MKRLFAAIKIRPSDEFVQHYYSLRAKLKDDRIKWVGLENIHITLKFFGETEEDKIPAMINALSSAAGQSEAFSLELRNTGIFGSSYNPRVIWFGIERSAGLKKLSNNVFNEISVAGWKPDRQNFVPHLTIARIKQIINKNYFQKIIDMHKEKNIQQVDVSEFYLIESKLTPKGPVYSVLEGFPLD